MIVQISFSCEFDIELRFPSDSLDNLEDFGWVMHAQVSVTDVTDAFTKVLSVQQISTQLTSIKDIDNVRQVFTATLDKVRALVGTSNLPMVPLQGLQGEVEGLERMICPKPGYYPLPDVAFYPQDERVVGIMPIMAFSYVTKL
jgi:hypothetical protein